MHGWQLAYTAQLPVTEYVSPGRVLREAEALDDAQMFCFLRWLDTDGDGRLSARDVYTMLSSPALWPTLGYSRRPSMTAAVD